MVYRNKIDFYIGGDVRRLFLMLMILGLWSGVANAYLLHKYQYACAPISKVYTSEEIKNEFLDNPKVNIYPDFIEDGAVVEIYTMKGFLRNSGYEIAYVPPDFRKKVKEGQIILLGGESFRHYLIAKERIKLMDILDEGPKADEYWLAVGLGVKRSYCPAEMTNPLGWNYDDAYKDGEGVWWKKR